MPRYYQVLRWHGWFKWGGLILAVGIVFLSVSGSVLYLSMRIQQWKRKAKAKAAAALAAATPKPPPAD